MRFVVISGLPGSGKTTLARRLAPALNLPLIDKDDILDRLFEEKGIGDAAWRRALSRESDAILQREAEASNGAVLVSFWHLPGMPVDSGTPTKWLTDVINIQCVCPPDLAVTRFRQRTRHAGHLDAAGSPDASIRDLARLPPLDIQPRIDVDTSGQVNVEDLVREIESRSRCG